MPQRREALIAAATTAGLSGSPTLLATLGDPAFAGTIAAPDVARGMDELGLADPHRLLQRFTPVSQAQARAGISGYRAGAAALGTSGAIHLGFNIENPGPPLSSTIHAEQAAVVNAWSRGETSLRALATSAAPCGHCRQFLSEVERGADIIMVFPGWPDAPLAQLLPQAFGPHSLGVSRGLMGAAMTPLCLCDGDEAETFADVLLRAALNGAESSHAPYSHSWAALAGVTQDGTVLTGRYAESAAFNPSLAPVSTLLALLRLHNLDPRTLVALTLVQVPQAVDHVASTREVLAAWGISAPLVLRAAVPQAADLTGTRVPRRIPQEGTV